MIQRYQFIPDTIWINGGHGWMIPLHRSDAPGKWMDICSSDDSIVTQVDDGHAVNGKGLRPTSSSTAPPVMRAMIEKLDIKSGLTVLEIGSGTGYNAALLAEIAGPGNVVTIELDKEIADHASRALAGAGYPIRPVIRDGALGYPERAPYDRVIATAAAQKIPYSWIHQTRPGGRLVIPWTPSFSPSGALLSLTARADGTADGKFTDTVAFMYLRAQRPEPVWWGDDEWAGDYTETRTHMSPPGDVFFGDADAGFALGVKLPELHPGKTVDEHRVTTLRLSHSSSGSWASFTTGTAGHQVRQHGPRRLWDEFESARQWWVQLGRPKISRFGMTVTAEGQHVWLDSPEKVVSS